MSRTTAIQTLGSGWVDSFGPGLGQIVIAGSTGWSGGPAGGDDWEAQYKKLYEVVWTSWHDAVEESKDPNSVELIFIDTLDQRAARVVPKNFVLKRNKTRPLLIQYNITLIAVEMVGDSAQEDDEQEQEGSQSQFNSGKDSLFDSSAFFDAMK